jgi:hypothetical protein
VGKHSTFVTFNITSKLTVERNPAYVNNVGKHFAIFFTIEIMNELTLDSNPMYVNNVERHTIPPVTFET